MSAPPLLIIISGPPASGKTALGQRLADVLHLPFVNRDAIKESLFDSLGWSDREWSKKLGIASYDLLYYFVRVQLKAGVSQIVESNFDAKYSSGEFLALKQHYNFRPFQIQCFTEGEALLERSRRRAISGERHPGHVEQDLQDELKPLLLKGRLEPLEIGGPLYWLHTTDFEKIDYAALLSAIQTFSTQP